MLLQRSKSPAARIADLSANQGSPGSSHGHGLGELTRLDQPSQYFPAIDGLRGIMATGIIFTHVDPDWFPGAPAMMDIFFVISGFLITLILFKNIRHDRINLKAFWIRRVKRLYPMLLLVVGAYLLLGGLLIEHAAPLFMDGLQTLLYVSNWTKLYNYIYPSYFGHTWSLSIEEQFYLLWPLWLALLIRRQTAKPRIILSCALLAIATILWRNILIADQVPWSRIYYSFDTRIDGFLSGGILAMLWQRWHALWYRQSWTTLAAQCCFALLVIAVIAWHPDNIRYFAWQQSAVILLSCGAIIALASPSDSLLKRFLSLRPFRQLGLMCYSIYLWHWPMIWLLMVRFHLQPLPMICIVLPVTIGLALLSYRYVEAPILSRRSRID